MNAWRLDTQEQTVIISSNGGIPFIAYWDVKLTSKEDLAQLLDSFPQDFSGGVMDKAEYINFCPTSGDGFLGQPGIILHDENGIDILPNFKFIDAKKEGGMVFESRDEYNGLSIFHKISIHGEVFKFQTTLQSKKPINVGWLSAPIIPDFCSSEEFVQVSGNWTNEFCFDRLTWRPGVVVKESRSGRTSHENFPGLILLNKNTTNSDGSAVGFHYGWSGGHRMQIEELSTGQRQIQFGHSQSFKNALTQKISTAPMFVSKSSKGLNGIAQSFQSFVRKEILPSTLEKLPRPVHYNCWEAIYFKHSLKDLKEIAKLAVTLGAERFVLDDGWFGLRDDDTSSLGDWEIDKRKYPEGLAPL
ncbi:alpha-galactosidase, partial [Amylibacter sp.]|nr:alpha-galactosidase [Amylibacter sp.]